MREIVTKAVNGLDNAVVFGKPELLLRNRTNVESKDYRKYNQYYKYDQKSFPSFINTLAEFISAEISKTGFKSNFSQYLALRVLIILNLNSLL